ncbi:MAG: S1 family peptidase [Sphaerochaeta sp.]
MKQHISQLLQYTSVRLNVTDKDGKSWTGTGFFVDALDESKKNRIPLLITNRHILKNGETLTLQLRTQNDEGEPQDNDQFKVTIKDLQRTCLYHPDEDVDIVAISIAFLLNNAAKEGKKIFTVPFTLNLIPNEESEKALFGLEDVLNIGYPDYIWDETNNLPIFRKGISVSNPTVNYEGEPEFLVDLPVLPGTSGSPVLIYSNTNVGMKDGKMQQAGRLILLGILTGPLQENSSLPTNSNPSIVIKARRIVDIYKKITEVAKAADSKETK